MPFKAREAFGTAPRPRTSEETLWREVAARMTLDACGYTNFSKADKGEYREHLKTMAEAHLWFRYDTADVALTFDLANVPHEPVVESIFELINVEDMFHEPD